MYTHLDTARSNVCAVTKDHEIRCWSQVGDGPDHGQAEVPEDIEFTQVGCGQMHTCGLTTEGTIECWGAGTGDELAKQAHMVAQPKLPEDRKYTYIASQMGRACALDQDGALVCYTAL